MESTSVHENEQQHRSSQHQLPLPSRAISTINPAEEHVNASTAELVVVHDVKVGEASRYEYSSVPNKLEPWVCGQPLTPTSQAKLDTSDKHMEALIERSIAREEERRRLEEEQARKNAAKEGRRGRRFSCEQYLILSGCVRVTADWSLFHAHLFSLIPSGFQASPSV